MVSYYLHSIRASESQISGHCLIDWLLRY